MLVILNVCFPIRDVLVVEGYSPDSRIKARQWSVARQIRPTPPDSSSTVESSTIVDSILARQIKYTLAG